MQIAFLNLTEQFLEINHLIKYNTPFYRQLSLSKRKENINSIYFTHAAVRQREQCWSHALGKYDRINYRCDWRLNVSNVL